MMSNQEKIFTIQPAWVKSNNASSKKNKSKVRTFLRKRRQTRSKTLQESNIDNKSRYIDCIYGPLALAICIAAPCTITFLPVSDVITKPECWYEVAFSTTSCFFFLASTVAMETEVALNPFKKRLVTVIIELFVTSKATEVLGYCLIHLIWYMLLGYFEPFPFKQIIMAYLSYIALLARLWKVIPKKRRKVQAFRKQFSAFLARLLWGSLISLQLTIISQVLGMISREVEWLIALIVPLTKIFHDRVIDKLVTKYATPENLAHAKIIGKIGTNITYSFWLAISFASYATKATEFVLLGINFCINMALCYKIIQLSKKVSAFKLDGDKKKFPKEQVLTELVLNEIVEILIPIAFIGSYCTAYYGPNKDILGNVGFEIWTYYKVEDLFSFLMPVVEMALLDFGSLILAGLLLWWLCSINIFKEYCKAIKKFWVYIVVWGGTMSSGVSIIDVNTKFIYENY